MDVEGAGSTGEGERTARAISRYQHETGIDIKYGEKTWRPVQSVIDVVQNHLDANTTVYEKGLLASIGVAEYTPKDPQQQRTVSLLNTLKFSSEPEVTQAAYRDLQGIVDTLPPAEVLHEQLEGINYAMPNMRVKVTRGEESKFVEYDEVGALPDEWEVTGFRIEDQGTGFDSRLLGMMGASTKSESSSKRGGLGEGLKMSITHLARSGANIRLLSHNDDQLWIARPHVEDGTISFKGIQREETDPHTTGSLTDVDFTHAHFDPDQQAEITQALDSRKGEGLGKYILEFRGPEFLPLINEPSELTTHGVPKGRVYVKGLLVEEADNLLFSYNLSEKWAIAGRDRKTVQQQILAENVRQTLQTITDHEQIAAVVGKLKERNTLLEIRNLDGSLRLPDEQQEAWRQSVQEAFNFEPGSAIFASEHVTPEQSRIATERGYNVIRLPAGNVPAIEFVKTLYPDQIVSLKDLEIPESGASEVGMPGEVIRTTNSVAEERPAKVEEAKLPPELEATLSAYKDKFMEILTNNALEQTITGEGSVSAYIGMASLHSVKFAPAKEDMVFEGDSPFYYTSGGNIVYVKEGINPADFQSIADLYVQLLKVPTYKDVFSEGSQEIVTTMAGRAVIAMRPELLTDFQLDSNEDVKKEKPTTYTEEQREADERIIAFFQKLDEVHRPGITLDDLVARLAELRQAKPDKAPSLDAYAHTGNSMFYSNGKIYRVTGHDLSIREVNFSGSRLRWPKRKSLYGLLSEGASEISNIAEETTKKVPRKSGKRLSFLDGLGDSTYLDSVLVGGESTPTWKQRLVSPEDTELSVDMNDLVYLPYELQDGESMTLTFARENGESQIVLKRKGNKTIATRIFDGSIENADGESKNYVFKPYGTMFDVYNNVVAIRSHEANTITIERNASGKRDQLPESNQGREFIPTNITINYGGEVWRDPRRILLDAVQNHIDAQGDHLPNIFYSVVNLDGTVERVSKEQLQQRDESWKIIGIEISDEGEGYPTPYLTRLGTSTKGDQDRGKYGEGLKMLAASAVRQGITVEASSRDWIARPRRYTQTVKDYESGNEQTFDFLGYDMQWQEQSRTGSSTSFSLLPPGAGDGMLDPDQRAEVFTKLSTATQTGKTWQSWVDVLDPRNVDAHGQHGLERFVLADEGDRPTDGTVTVLSSQSGSIYEKGLLIPRDASEPMIFGYNIDETIIDTRERNAFNPKLLDQYLTNYFRNLTDTHVMRQILEMTRQQPEISFYEYKFMDHGTSEMTKALWRKTYFEVFGNDAVLSLRPIYADTQNRTYSYSANLWRRHSGQEQQAREQREAAIARAVAVEEHIQTLQSLPLGLTKLFADRVYTSKEFRDSIDGGEVEIPAEEKEKLVGLIQTTNQMMLTILESLDSNTSSRAYLGKIVSDEELTRRKEQLRQVKPENIRIKNVTFPALGMVEVVDGEPVTFLNQSIIHRPSELVDTYVHEASHFLSGQRDFVLHFQRFMMAIAMSRGIPARN